MDTLVVLLLFIFGGVALMVVLGERFARPADAERLAKLQRWIMPLVGLSIVISLINYYVN
ncbi:MAG: hypothetical protein Hals2KO_38160 [Halioglobus sp.]